MNYKKIYDSLIDRAKQRGGVDGYYEVHHIIPICQGGSDDEHNLVKLTAREHFIAHALLFKTYRTSKLAYAWNMMTIKDPNQERYYNGRLYESAKKARSAALKKEMKGKGNNFYGRRHTEETKRKISEKRKLKKTSDETRAKMSATRKGVPKSEEHKRKIGRKGLVAIRNIHTGEHKRVSGEEWECLGKDVWKGPGYFSTQKRHTCVHCGIETTIGNINRWHNDNCKKKGTLEQRTKA